jgi:outer membrane protein assembly factor BamB
MRHREEVFSMKVRRIRRVDAVRVWSLCILLLIAMYSGSGLSFVFAEDPLYIDEERSWPTFHGNNERTGATTFAEDQDSLQVKLGLWRYGDLSPVFSSCMSTWILGDTGPVYTIRGRVCAGAGDSVDCLDARTGEKIWTLKTEGGVHSTPAAFVIDGALMVAVGSLDGNMYGLFGVNGSIRWIFETLSNISSSSVAFGEFSPGRVFFGAWDGKVYCLNASTGAHLWNYTTGDQVDSSPAVVDGRVFIGSNDHRVYCLNASTGTHLWNYTTGDWVASTPAVVDGRLYVGSYDTNVYCLNASTGAWIWNFTTGHFVYSSPAVADRRVFIGSYDHNVYCLDALTGVQLWNFTTGDWVASSPAVADGLLFVGSFDHTFYCLNKSDGSHVWNYTTGGMISASPAIANGLVYVGSLDGAIYAFGVLTSQYVVEPDGYQFDVEVVSNSRLSGFTFDQSMKTLSVNVTGDPGISGYCAVTFPTALLGGPYVCQLNGTLITPEEYSNATHTTLAFTYPHSTHTLEIIGTTVIPDLASILMTIYFALTLVVLLAARRNLRQYSR